MGGKARETSNEESLITRDLGCYSLPGVSLYLFTSQADCDINHTMNTPAISPWELSGASR